MFLRPTRSILQAGIAAAVLAGFATAPSFAETRGGTFEGAAGHSATGSVSVVQEGDGYKVVFSDDYSVDNAPDPYVSFGSKRAFEEGTDFAKMSGNGAQSYEVPAGIDPAEFETLWVWCKRFGVPLAKADLQ